jgi:hypothetical protein
VNLVAIEQITFDGENISAAGREIGFGAGKFFRITCEESNTSALVGNVPCQNQPESPRPSSNQCDLVA